MPSSSNTTSTTLDATPPESRNQLIVALAIVIGLVVLGLALIASVIVSVAQKLDTTTIAAALGVATAIGTIIGALATALNAPTGIGRVLSNAMKPSPASGQDTEDTNANASH